MIYGKMRIYDKNAYLSFSSRDMFRENNVRVRSSTAIHSREQRYICAIHRPLARSGLHENLSIRKRCIECLRVPVYAYVKRYEVVIPNHNYIFPMLCGNCSDIAMVCKWCRPSFHKFMLSY